MSPKRGLSATELRDSEALGSAATSPTGQIFGYPSLSYVLPHRIIEDGVSSGANHSADQLTVFPFVIADDISVDRLGLEVITSGAANVRLGIWNGDGTDFQPKTLVVDSGEIDVSTTGYKEGTFTAVPLYRGRAYWIGFNTDAASATWGMRGAATGRHFGWNASTNLHGGGNLAMKQASVTYGALVDFTAPVNFDGIRISYLLMRVA